MKLIDTIKILCDCAGVAGDEKSASVLALSLIKPYAKSAYIDDYNNVIAVISEPKAGKQTILLDAHIDQIGLIVTAIDKNGFLRVSKCGGIDRRLLLGQCVRILAEDGELFGTVSFVPSFLTDGEKKVPEVDSILIDIGMSHEEACKVVNLGDRIILHSDFKKLLGTRISSVALDDRCGVAAILEAVKKLSDSKLNCGLTVLFSAQEEIGENGAKIAGYNINADIAIAVDVSFAHTPDAEEFKCGEMGKGVMIGIAPTLDCEIYSAFTELSEKLSIPYQLEVMGGSTGTNADALGISHGGMKTGLLSIPQKYMHTPIEVIDLEDINSVSDLLAHYVLSVGSDDTDVLLFADEDICVDNLNKTLVDEDSLLAKLTALNAVSGNEDSLRDFIQGEVSSYCNCSIDNLGNLICRSKNFNDGKTDILLTASMDEVGLIITGVTSDGLLKFTEVGEIDERVILGRAVEILHSGNLVTGVIGTKAMHQQSAEERKSAVKLTSMFIDIGASSKDEALKSVNLGDFVSLIGSYKKLSDDKIMGRALNSRCACAVLIDLIKTKLPVNVSGVFTVQSALSSRGARTCVKSILPNSAIVISGTFAADITGIAESKTLCSLDGGAVLNIIDDGIVYNKTLYSKAVILAKEHSIPFQNKSRPTAVCDAAAISTGFGGVKTLNVSFPCRYIGTANTVVSLNDVKAVKDLVSALIKERS